MFPQSAPSPGIEVSATPLQGVISVLQNLVVGQSAMTAAINALTVQISALPGWVPVPATAASAGVAGQIAYDATHFYVCVAANTWVRVVLATF